MTPAQSRFDRLRWLSWILGGAMLVAVVVTAVRHSEPRELYRLVQNARLSWLLIALLLQAGTYLFQGEIWRIVTRAAGAPLAVRTVYWLSVGKLLVDQVLPSAGISGSALMVKALERRGVPRPVVMAGVVVDTASCYGTYVLGLGTALLITLVHHHASGLILFTSIPFAAGGIGVTVAVLVFSGRRTGAVAERVAQVGPLRRALRFFADADRRLVRRPRILLEAGACQLAILLLDAATVWVLIAALGATAAPSGVFASFMIATLFRIVGFVPGGLGTFEAASVLTLKAIGVGLLVALAATLLFRGLSFWLPMFSGSMVRPSCRRPTTTSLAGRAFLLPILLPTLRSVAIAHDTLLDVSHPRSQRPLRSVDRSFNQRRSVSGDGTHGLLRSALEILRSSFDLISVHRVLLAGRPAALALARERLEGELWAGG